METGKLIRELRLKKGLTQEELAERTEVSSRTIQRIENGEVDPRAYTLQMIAKALDVDFDLFTQSSDEDARNENVDKDRGWLALLHLSGILPLFFPSIIIWKRKKDEIKEITEHYRAVIAFQSMILFLVVVGLWANYQADAPEAFYVIIPLGIFFAIWNALKVLNGRPYKYFGLFRPRRINKE